MKVRPAVLAAGIAVVLAATPSWAQRGGGPGAAGGAAAQQAPVPDAPAPRLPDGHVALGSSKAAKGYWEVRPGLGGRGDAVPAQPWARALQQYRGSRVDLYPPSVNCKPSVGPGFFNAPGFDFIDAPDQASIFIVNIAGPHSWRQIFMDGRPHPPADTLRPTFFGHSTGKWEGDTLVIDSVGFNEKMWVAGSYPTTTQLHLTERITRTGLKSLNYEATIDDPGAFTAPWTTRWSITPRTASSWIEGGEIFEYICQDDRNDVQRAGSQ